MSDLLVASRLIMLTASKRFVTDVFNSVDSCLLAIIFYWEDLLSALHRLPLRMLGHPVLFASQ